MASAFTDEALRSFFAFTDRGIKPSQETSEYNELLARFKSIGITEAGWLAGFRDGTLSPLDFYDEPDVFFEAARKIDRHLQGGERTIWRIMEGGRRWGIPLNALYDKT